MAFDPKPSTWLGAGFAASSANHTITLNTGDASTNKTLPLLTDAEADPTTGDVRKLALALAQALYAAYLAQATADRPAKFTAQRTSANSDTTATTTKTFIFTFVCDETLEVAAE